MSKKRPPYYIIVFFLIHRDAKLGWNNIGPEKGRDKNETSVAVGGISIPLCLKINFLAKRNLL